MSDDQLLIKNIGMLVVDNHGKPCLCGDEMSRIEVLRDAWLLIENGRFKAWGEQSTPLPPYSGSRREADAEGGAGELPAESEYAASEMDDIAFR